VTNQSGRGDACEVQRMSVHSIESPCRSVDSDTLIALTAPIAVLNDPKRPPGTALRLG
jgi:hypothetical protein